MIPKGALDAGSTVAQLAENHGSGNFTAPEGIIGNPVLLPAQKHIAAAFPADPGQEPAPGRAEGKADAIFRTLAHEGRRGPGIGKADNGLEGVQRIPGNDLPLPVGQHILSLQGQIDVLGGDKEGVEQLLHGVSSRAAFR